MALDELATGWTPIGVGDRTDLAGLWIWWSAVLRLVPMNKNSADGRNWMAWLEAKTGRSGVTSRRRLGMNGGVVSRGCLLQLGVAAVGVIADGVLAIEGGLRTFVNSAWWAWASAAQPLMLDHIRIPLPKCLVLNTDKEIDSSKELKGDDKSEKKIESASPGQAVVINKKQKDDHEPNGSAADKEGGETENSEEKGGATTVDESNNVGKKELRESTGVQSTSGLKPVKKKIVKKNVKQKVADKKEGSDDPAKQTDKLDEKNLEEKTANSEITGQQDVSPANAAGVKTFIRKKVVKKVPVAKAVQKDDEGMEPEVKTDKGPEYSEDKSKGESDSSSAAIVQDPTAKTTAKKKVIKRVVKRKVTGAAANEGVSDGKKDDVKDGIMVVQAGKEAKVLGDQTVDADSPVGAANTEKKIAPKTTSKSASPKKQDNLGNSSKTGSKAEKEDKKVENRVDEKSGSASKVDNEADKQKVSHKDTPSGKREKSKDEEKKDKEKKDDSRNKSTKEVKEKKQIEEPPRHPGLFLQTKRNNDSKLRSLSLSLDSLLDYTDKDFEESTFELSLFAESLYEMLQHQMGSRILSFLQKLRIKFLKNRNQRKRQREEISKGSDKKSSTKRAKIDGATVEAKSTKTETQDAAHCDGKTVKEEDTSVDGKSIVKENTSVDGKSSFKEEDTSGDGAENDKPEDEMVEEDPEEDPEEAEDEEMLDASHQHDLSNEARPALSSPFLLFKIIYALGKLDADTKSGKRVENAKDKQQETAKETSESKLNAEVKEQETAKETSESKPNAEVKKENESKETSESKPISGSDSKENVEKMETKKREIPVVVDKELLQAFRFFDRNQVGYIRVEDMRLIIHNLGKFLSYRDVKELAQSALLESNTGRDDRILYNKLGMCVLVREAMFGLSIKVTGGGKDNKIVIQMQLKNTFGFGFVFVEPKCSLRLYYPLTVTSVRAFEISLPEGRI
ncbi:ATP/GTP-binding protein family [Actinidia rufa]|uniref:ATP/GTP-binding protein family n=1 Tax=Actinidia rufa TaxID=165716 RepID=A0A7J0DQH7_9ERIC|nr:ATP/GTP-binding protein family [Actinidia rufa]